MKLLITSALNNTETVTCEADDLIAGYTRTYEKETEIIISSFDSDFFQLITDKVSVLRYRGDKTVICTPEYIEEKYGIFPRRNMLISNHLQEILRIT